MKLVIVESPSKCNSISKYLGKGYKVVASKGHIRELATSGEGGLGIDIKNDFEPTYKIIKAKKPLVDSLIKDAKAASEVILASDNDREGEAIAWHLCQVLGLDETKTKRLLFNEITKDAIENAIKNPSVIKNDLVYSQEARRMLDRIIGFKLSTLINRKLHSRSAGRVQSATLKLICDRQEEINNFVPEEYYTLDLLLSIDDKKELKVSLDKIDGKKAHINNAAENELVLKELDNEVKFKSLSTSKKLTSPKLPLKTSTMQQAAFSSFGFQVSKTSRIAQQLYEGVEINGEVVGLVTYIRVDSVTFSQTFINYAKNFIVENYGQEYLSNKIKNVNAPEGAHEPIRPTSLSRTPDKVRPYLTNDQYKLYKLIYERAISSLMADKVYEKQTVEIEVGKLLFKAEGTRTLFDGFEKVLSNKDNDSLIPVEVKEGNLKIKSVDNKQQFTNPPAPYNDAKIIAKMEEVGIGRPSTYASTIATLTDVKRDYIRRDESGNLIPTDKGMLTSRVLNKYFHDFVDCDFTAKMEQELDEISEGNITRKKVMEEFYDPFINLVKDAEVRMYSEPKEYLDKTCPKCGSPLVIKKGKYGDFTTCSNYPHCDYVEKELKYTGENCPICGKPLIEKGKGRKKFIGCSGYPSCNYIKKEEKPKFTSTIKSDGKTCPKCGGQLVEKKGKFGKFLGCSNYPKCRYQEKISKK